MSQHTGQCEMRAWSLNLRSDAQRGAGMESPGIRGTRCKAPRPTKLCRPGATGSGWIVFGLKLEALPMTVALLRRLTVNTKGCGEEAKGTSSSIHGTVLRFEGAVKAWQWQPLTSDPHMSRSVSVFL